MFGKRRCAGVFEHFDYFIELDSHIAVVVL
jgi:hypothetical protein